MNWLDRYMKYTEGTSSPAIFHKWAGIFCVSAVLERKVWIASQMGRTFPNLYVFLVAPPGVGKGVALTPAQELLGELDYPHLASSNVTRASMVDELKESERHIIDHSQTPPAISFNSMAAIVNEMGVFLPAYDADFMAFLTDVWDNKSYSERRRTKDLKIKMDSVCLQILAGGTPNYLTNFLPMGAWEQGFMTRVIPVYSGENILVDFFQERPFQGGLKANLVKELKEIGSYYGPMKIEADAREALIAWHMAKGPPTPDHPKLLGYNTRRTAQLMKLCMISSAMEGPSRIISLDNYAEALDWLIEVEQFIPDIFRVMASGGDQEVVRETWHFAFTLYAKDKKPISEQRIISFLMERTASHNVIRLLDLMERTGVFRSEILQGVGKAFIPAAPKK